MDHRKYMRWACLSLGAALGFMPSPAHASFDLEIQSVSVQVQSAPAGQNKSVTVTAQVRNNGSEEASGFTVSVAVRQNGKLIREIKGVPVLSKLPRGASGLSVPVNVGEFAEGEYEAVASVKGPFDETRGDNNSERRDFRVTASYSGVYSPGGSY